MFHPINMSGYAFPPPEAPANPYYMHPQPVPTRHFTFRTEEPPMLRQSGFMDMNPVTVAQPLVKQEGYFMAFAPRSVVNHTPINQFPQQTGLAHYFPNSV